MLKNFIFAFVVVLDLMVFDFMMRKMKRTIFQIRGFSFSNAICIFFQRGRTTSRGACTVYEINYYLVCRLPKGTIVAQSLSISKYCMNLGRSL